jgi:two-component system chemotaxis response regulator CheB
MSDFDLVAIGTSWGGLDALSRLLPELPADFGAAVAVVQHRAPGSHGTLEELLGGRTALEFVDLEDKTPVRPGCLYVAPADYHLLVEREGHFALSTEGRVQYSRPSADVLFETAADAYGERLAAVVLTGANADGAAGLVLVKAHGGTALVQDPEEAEMPSMPRAAIAAAEPDAVLPLAGIAEFLRARCRDVQGTRS